jgi:hypothetical protein
VCPRSVGADGLRKKGPAATPDCRPFSREAAADLTELYNRTTTKSKSSVSIFSGSLGGMSGLPTPQIGSVKCGEKIRAMEAASGHQVATSWEADFLVGTGSA